MPKSQSSQRAAALAALLIVSAYASAAEYNIEAIVSPTGGDVYPTSISKSGMVVGWINSVTGSSTACFKYKNRAVKILPLPALASSCKEASTDLQGNITMTVTTLDSPAKTKVFELSSKGVFTELTGLANDDNLVRASAGGKMAGYSKDSNGQPQAYIFRRSGAGTNVGALTGYPSSILVGITAKGAAIGNAFDSSSGVNRAFKYSKNKIDWLPPLSTRGAYATAINSNDVAVGSSHESPSGFETNRATVWQGNQPPKNLGSLNGQSTVAQAVNLTGDIVGSYGIGAGGLRIRNESLTALSTLIPPSDLTQWGFFLGEATAISDSGLIAGGGFSSRYNGQAAGYLLRPIP